MNQWSALIVLGCFISSPLVSAPPEEIRIGSLGARGVSFTEDLPGTFSEVVSAAGDVNGDGLGDVLLLHHETALDYATSLFLVPGSTDLPATIPTADLATIATAFRMAGPRYHGADIIRGMAPGGDIDGDTFDDFFIFRPFGSPLQVVGGEDDPIPGVAYLVHGSASLPREVLLESPVGIRTTVFTSSRSKRTSLALSAATGDLNGDGRTDLAFGAGFAYLDDLETEYSPGRLYVLLGDEPFEGTVDVEEAGRERPGFILEGHADGAGLGESVLFPGDVNGDGFGDLVVGSSSSYGRDPSWVYIVFGAPEHPSLLTVADLLAGLGVRFTGPGSASNIGETLAAPGDVNGDGLADLLIAASGASLQKGEVYLIHGRPDFPANVALADLVELGLGVVFRGVQGDVFGGEHAGASVAALDYLGDGAMDFAIGAPGAPFREIPRVGKVYIVEGRTLEPGIVSLGGIEEGTLPGAVITAEVSLTSGVAAEPHLGVGAAATGDVDGDGLEDLLVSEPSRFTVTQAGKVHLIYGSGTSGGPLLLERVEPDTVELNGGSELTLIGSGFDAAVEVRIGGAVAPVKRAITTARLVVEAPQLGSTGPADVTVTRDGETATLAGGVVYVPYLHTTIDVLDLGTTHPGVIVHGPVRNFGESIAMLDLDADGLSDIVVESGTGVVAVLYGSSALQGVLDLRDLGTGVVPDGVSLIHAPVDLFVREAGDLNGDGRDDLAIAQVVLLTVLFGEGRLPPEADLGSLVLEGRGVDVLTSAVIVDAAGGGDLDGDGLEDLALTVGTSTGSIHLLAGRRFWPRELFLDDSSSVITSTVHEDRFGSFLAVLGDASGDGLADLLAGAPGQFWRDDGNGHVILGGAWPPAGAETVQSLLALGLAARIDAFKAKDGIGRDVCAPGDFNGDGFPDLALSAEGGGVYFQGESYVVFGGPGLASTPGPIISLADLGARGVRILGEETYDYAVNLAPAGDFDGDGLSDLLVAASGIEARGKAYVVFGGPARTVRLWDLGDDGVRVSASGTKFLGWSVAGGGDFNGDGLSDVVLADAPLPPLLGSIYIVFGQGPVTFIRGDSNADDKVELSDPVRLLGHLFLGTEPPPCLDAADGNDSGALDITDAIFILEHLFLGGAAPPPPYPDPGFDITPDDLRCGRTP